MSDWWTTTPAQSTEDVPVEAPPDTRLAAMAEQLRILIGDPMPVARPGDPPRCTCRHCLGSRPGGTCDGRCSDCGRPDCAQCRRSYPQDDTCGECGGDGCIECCNHDIESCCGWCDVCESHPESNVDRYDVCDKGHCHSCDHECSDY